MSECSKLKKKYNFDSKKNVQKWLLQNHPDKNPSPEAHEKFKEMSEAYETIGDAEKRKQAQYKCLIRMSRQEKTQGGI